MEKVCSKCKILKSHIHFCKYSKTKDKLNYYCKSCAYTVYKEWSQRSNVKKYRNKKRRLIYKVQSAKGITVVKKMRSFIDSFKTCCSICSEKRKVCLQFHHLYDGYKNHNVSDLLATGNKQRIVEEIAMCIVVCGNCHRKITAKVIEIPKELYHF